MIYLIWKEKGITSFKKIRNFANENNFKKVGHSGTLDPLAQGLLLIATDKDTKWLTFLDQNYKKYRVYFQLGKSSDTYDIEGKILETSDKKVTKEELEKTIFSFLGKIKQIPPIYSAKKVNGKKAYEYARENKSVTLNEIDVEIKQIHNLNFDFDNNLFSFDCEVSRGTYIRSLIHDIGLELGTYALMSDLIRFEIDGLTDQDLGEVEVNKLIKLNKVSLKLKRLKKLYHGQRLELDLADGDYVFDLNNNGIYYGVLTAKDKEIKIKKLIRHKELAEIFPKDSEN
ncbi:tRNA pseudouridine(55) synthase TruB [Mycoplasmopsis agassizii]|uniref:tRNA pseudouridine synthase B n=1 Tax=Mycoplasmopsis agassizii TaxID=33922 RepID=A0ABX4H793_9BACT|nr:tRNA pseudouridine(55) synthase TruB [Mycoplasmopsis agassizii]PAF55543.1 tRNA pseudouridine(55) synthase TruB [Mycoplasmopsis agassizii]SMC17903.1 tRNA pseudouridine synthase B [Mycoplasmopsis agassizii]